MRPAGRVISEISRCKESYRRGGKLGLRHKKHPGGGLICREKIERGNTEHEEEARIRARA